jgi:uncharacterized protein YeaO (DUF488 family)
MPIKTKSVDSPIDRQGDGLRILATRIRGRGLPKNRYNVWMPNLAPSEKLLRQGKENKISWEEFAQLYFAEIFEAPPLDRGNKTIRNHGQKFTLRLLQQLARKGPVTVMCHCSEDQQRCHRHLLKALLDHPALKAPKRLPAHLKGRDPSILKLNLHREFFDAIASGEKRIEYREASPYWKQRLEGRSYDYVEFRNGYAKDAPEMLVEVQRIAKAGKGRSAEYHIHLGKVLETKRWRPAK